MGFKPDISSNRIWRRSTEDRVQNAQTPQELSQLAPLLFFELLPPPSVLSICLRGPFYTYMNHRRRIRTLLSLHPRERPGIHVCLLDVRHVDIIYPARHS